MRRDFTYKGMHQSVGDHSGDNNPSSVNRNWHVFFALPFRALRTESRLEDELSIFSQ